MNKSSDVKAGRRAAFEDIQTEGRVPDRAGYYDAIAGSCAAAGFGDWNSSADSACVLPWPKRP